VKAINFDVCKKPTSLSDLKTNAILYCSDTSSVKDQSIVVAEIFGEMPIFEKGAIVSLVISGITGPILITFAQHVATILPLNIFQSELPYISLQFQNGSLLNEGHFANFA